MSYSFDKQLDNEEENERQNQLPNLSKEAIYCPKCGYVNSFAKSSPNKTNSYLCSRCKVQLKEFWDNFSDGSLQLTNCVNCSESTFENQIYCIHCGTKQEAGERSLIFEEEDFSSEEKYGRRDSFSTSESDEMCMCGFETLLCCSGSGQTGDVKSVHYKWVRLSFTSKMVIMIGGVIINIFVALGTLFVSLEMSNYLPIIMFSCVFICLIVVSAFVNNYEDKLRYSKNIDSDRLRKEIRPVPIGIMLILLIFFGGLFGWLLGELLNRFLRCS